MVRSGWACVSAVVMSAAERGWFCCSRWPWIRSTRLGLVAGVVVFAGAALAAVFLGVVFFVVVPVALAVFFGLLCWGVGGAWCGSAWVAGVLAPVVGSASPRACCMVTRT